MKVLITSGGTREYIDDVRIITNISTGGLGAIIAPLFLNKGHDVTYLSSKTAIQPKTACKNLIRLVECDSVKEVYEAMKTIVPSVDLVIHAMAMSDFTFESPQAPVKLKSNDPEAFIEYMREHIRMAPKVIANVKIWNPNAKLVGFKFESGSTHEELVRAAMKQMQSCGCDWVVANDKQEMKKESSHIAYIISSTGKDEVRCTSKHDIAAKLYREVTASLIQN
jgi:phosphopantothenate-cysteine ligase